MKKKFLVLMLAFSMFLSGNLHAAEKPVVNGDLPYEKGAKVYIPTERDIKIIKEREKETVGGKYGIKGFDYGSQKTLSVIPFEQEKSYYCGPATVKQVVNFIKGYSLSQQEYATMLSTNSDGTDMVNIANILPNLTGKNYVYYTFSDYNGWVSKIIKGIDGDRPSILDINTYGISAWPYNTSGHFVNTSGYSTTHKFKVRITDPYGPGFGNRWYSMSDVYEANKNHFRSAMIW